MKPITAVSQGICPICSAIASMREAYVGVGVSHRSGIFGSSRLLGNVNGGSNYIYSYLEWRM
jgi:hypothetical protein